MFRPNVNKTNLYKLVGAYEDLPPMHRVEFKEAPRTPDWWLKWADADGVWYVATFAANMQMGKALLSIQKRALHMPYATQVIHTLDARDLMERGMVEEFTTAAEGRAAIGASKEQKQGGITMDRVHRSQLREILLQLTELKNSIKAIHWEVGEKIPVEQSITIQKATASLQDTIGHLTEVI